MMLGCALGVCEYRLFAAFGLLGACDYTLGNWLDCGLSGGVLVVSLGLCGDLPRLCLLWCIVMQGFGGGCLAVAAHGCACRLIRYKLDRCNPAMPSCVSWFCSLHGLESE